MPWFPEFSSAVELARRQTRAAGLADPVGQYFAALNNGDTRVLETVWPGEVTVYDPRAGEIRGHRTGARDQRGERGSVPGREGERPVGAVVRDDRGLADPATDQPDTDRAHRLARHGVVGIAVLAARRQPAPLETGREPPTGRGELPVELPHQERAEEQGGDPTEERAGQQQDADQTDGQPAAQGPVRGPAGAEAIRDHDGGRRM